MYPLRMPYRKVRSRLRNLVEDGYASEALVTSVFTAERLLRRTLVQLVVSAGFTSNDAFRVVQKMNGLMAVKEAWSLYDPKSRTLVQVIGNATWQQLQEAAKIRNDMVHGMRTYSQGTCKRRVHELLAAIDTMKEQLKTAYEFDGWGMHRKRRVSALHTDPKVPI
jgi:hypothetical protein